MHDLCDGTIFKESEVFKINPNGLQIILYYDEFTAVNPMAPTSQKYKIGTCMHVCLYFIVPVADLCCSLYIYVYMLFYKV